MGFTWVRGSVGTWSSGSTFSVTLAAAPATGTVVCCGIITYNGTASYPTITSIKDTNSNSYQVTPNSPSSSNANSAGAVFTAYLLSAPSNATATITVTVSGTITFGAIWADVFTVSGGTAAFDTDIAGNGSTGTTINTPTIAPAANGSLLYCCAGSTGSGITSANSPWTGAGGGISSGNDSAYDASSSGSVQVNFTQGTGGWDSMAMSIKLTSSSFVPDEDFWKVSNQTAAEPVITVY